VEALSGEMNNAAFYISITSGVLTVGLLGLVVAGKISTKTYYKIVFSALTGILALATLFVSVILAIAVIDLLFLKKFGYPIWSLIMSLPFVPIFGVMTRWSLILLKSVRSS
jgi:hypothetical protein